MRSKEKVTPEGRAAPSTSVALEASAVFKPPWDRRQSHRPLENGQKTLLSLLLLSLHLTIMTIATEKYSKAFGRLSGQKMANATKHQERKP